MTFVTRVCACACVAFAISSECRSVCVAHWPWLPERVVVVHIPCVLTYSTRQYMREQPFQARQRHGAAAATKTSKKKAHTLSIADYRAKKPAPPSQNRPRSEGPK